MNILRTIVVFADDNTPMYVYEDPDVLKENLETQALKITYWFQANKMVVSGEMTKLLVFGTQINRSVKLANKTIKVCVDGHETQESESEKLLGFIVNEIEAWKNHLHGDEDNLELLKDLSKWIGMLKQLRINIPTLKFKMLISGLFTSRLIYGLSAWAQYVNQEECIKKFNKP